MAFLSTCSLRTRRRDPAAVFLLDAWSIGETRIVDLLVNALIRVSQALMQLEQGQRPSSAFLVRWSAFLAYGKVKRLHAFLFSDGSLFKGVCVLCRVSQ